MTKFAETEKEDIESAKQNILVVDDTPANLRLLLSILSRSGYNVRPVLSGAQALEAVEVQQPDIILLDVNMPEMNGYEVASRLKQDPKATEIPIIFISANDDTEAKIKAFELGGVDYVVKPFQEAEVLARVRTHLDLKRFQREIIAKSLETERAELLAAFFDKASHEFRTPLSSILTNADLLERTKHKPETFPKYISRIKEGCHQIDNLVDNILLMIQLNEDSSFDMAKINLGAFINDVVWGLDDSRIRLNRTADDIFVNANTDMLKRAIIEIVHNAQQHTADSEHIYLRVYVQQEMVVIEVEDNGKGIPDEHFPHIFEMFYRVDQAHTTRGFGLGLPMAKRIVTKHKGTIYIEAAYPKGVKAMIQLPTVP